MGEGSNPRPSDFSTHLTNIFQTEIVAPLNSKPVVLGGLYRRLTSVGQVQFNPLTASRAAFTRLNLSAPGPPDRGDSDSNGCPLIIENDFEML